MFDGAEDRNGIRNSEEIRFWSQYISDPAAPWLCDDKGACGGLASDALFVVAGDHNADPVDGGSTGHPMTQLLEHPRVLRFEPPTSQGAEAAAIRVGGGNLTQKGVAAQDTGDFGPRVGNLRLDYVLPSTGFVVHAGGVFWPLPGQTGGDWIEATDHHMVWMDLGRR
ncbi:MAG: endonuclease/exonuclease/phosphatase family protein [Frankiaceae bacterium]|nr:endonuclease/exonuclease/phosphatase family protein [Arenimonas sp.]